METADLFDLPEQGWVAGVDEVGRGPLAGDVVAAAVVLGDQSIDGLTDSKALSPARRERLANQIRAQAKCWALGRASVEEIDRHNILEASLLAMRRAVDALPLIPVMVLVDGNRLPKWPYPSRPIVKGDLTEPCISAASILAKVQRDSEMEALDDRFPGYGFAAHKGYPTKAHIAALERLGVLPVHRKSFAPVKRLLPQPS